MTDASAQLSEAATYCKPNDPKRPGVVGLPDATTSQVCPADGAAATEVTNAYPDGWYIRVMFDELLDPSIETLTEITDDTGAGTGTFTGSIAGTHPVTLQCQSVNGGALVNVDYDGYYSPAGNNVTWPLGPSLVIKPNNPKLIATNKECQITLSDAITDKDGIAVPADERGPFKFKIAPIKVISIDPSDDPDYASPIDAEQIYFDNPYIQFNTLVDPDSFCPDAGGDGFCDDEKVFSIKDVAHPDEGPGYCNVSFTPCGSIADCMTSGATPDTVCGRGFCTDAEDPTGGSFTPCNKPSDCAAPDDSCGTNYAYSYVPFGLTAAEFGAGPPEPIETEHKYTFSFTQGAVLKDRCGAETTLGAPSAADLTLVHFITNKFTFNKATIANGETASAMKRLQFNFSNVPEGSDTSSGARGIKPDPAIDTTEFTMTPAPKKMTGPCPGSGGACPTADLTPAETVIISSDGSGMPSLQGHLQMNTEYTFTLKAGAVVNDFYGKAWTNTADMVIKWKTQPAILMTGLSVRNTGALVSVASGGTLVRPTPTTTTDVRLGFNASMDPTTLDLADVAVEPAVANLAVVSASGCGNGAALAAGGNLTGYIGGCTLRLRGQFAAGDYKVTLKQGAQFKDIFGVTYTQAADQSMTFTITDASAPEQCL